MLPRYMNPTTYIPDELLGPLNAVERKHAPEHLYVAGDLGILQSGARVAIVGARQASPAGLARARKLAARLVREGAVVVSGLALGIDTAAHTAAIAAGGRTIAVIGTPLERAYPRENELLQARIATDHLLVSQFPSGTKTQRFHFPQRNRTMALISDATVIIEAGETSGSLSQGWEALRLGRLLYITHAVASDPALKWPASMLDYGARILSDASLGDFLDALPPREPASLNAAVPF